MTSPDIRELARMLGGSVVGHQILCPGPGHSPTDRSLSVKLDANAPGGFLVNSFAGDDMRVCRDLVRARLHLQPWQKQQRPPHTRRVTKPTPVPANDAETCSQAIRLIGEAKPLQGTVAETYLMRRIGRALAWPEDLRFHPECPRKVGEQLERHPALIILLRDIFKNEPRAIQRIFLKSDGSDRLRDPQAKMCLGPAAGAVAKLSPDDCVTHGLGIAEGVETALGVMSRGWAPLWATVGTAGLAHFPVLAGVACLTVFADHDQRRAGDAAALACINRWQQAGHEAKGIKPRIAGQDWADVVGGDA